MCIPRLRAVVVSLKTCAAPLLLYMSDKKSLLLYVLVCDKYKRIVRAYQFYGQAVIDVLSGDTTHTTAVWAMPYAIPDTTWFSSCTPADPFPYRVNEAGWIWVVLVNHLFSVFGETKDLIVFLGDDIIYRARRSR